MKNEKIAPEREHHRGPPVLGTRRYPRSSRCCNKGVLQTTLAGGRRFWLAMRTLAAGTGSGDWQDLHGAARCARQRGADAVQTTPDWTVAGRGVGYGSELEGAEPAGRLARHVREIRRPARAHGSSARERRDHAAKEQQGFSRGRIGDIERKLAMPRSSDIDAHSATPERGSSAPP